MYFEKLTVRELEEMLSKIEDKDKVVEVFTNCVRGIDNATSIEEYESSIVIG